LPLPYQGFEVVKVFEAFQHNQVTENQITGTLKTNPKQQLSQSCLFKDNNFCRAFYFTVSICITFLKYMYKSNKS